MTTYTPDVIIDIIYKNLHELKMADIMLELVSKSRMCVRCDEIHIVNKRINQHKCLCGDVVCTYCYEEDIQYMEEVNADGETNNYTYNGEIPCLCNIEFDVDDYITDSDYEEYDEDDIWQEMYGITHISEIY